nr:hypothetical protein [Candidatus Sigynarchaeota archaeon]
MKRPQPKEVQKFFGRLIAYVVICVAIIASSILIKEFAAIKERMYTNDSFADFPANYVPPGFNSSRYNILLDQHSHTIASDGAFTPEQNIIWHIKHGFNATFITDHGRNDYAIEAQRIAREKYPGFIVLVGEEWSNDRVHLNLLDIAQPVLPSFFTGESDAAIQSVINFTHDQGGLVVLNHLPWSGINSTFRDQLISWGVDYIEVVNENVLDNESWAYCNSTTEPNKIGVITGTDVHSPTAVHSWTTIWTPEFSEDAIMAQLHAKNTSFIYNYAGSPDYTLPPVDNPVYSIVAPIMYFGQAFEDIYQGGTLTLIMGLSYLFSGFFIAEVLRVVKRRYWEFINTKKGTVKDTAKP